MAEYTGSDLFVSFGGTSLAADFRRFENNETNDTVDASAGSDIYKRKLSTLIDGSCRLELVAQTSGTQLWTALKPGSEGTLIWAEEGTASGKQKHTVNAIVTARNKTAPYNDVVIVNCDFDFNGDVTDGVY